MGVRDTINSTNRKGFRVSAIIDRVSEARKQRLDQRLDKHNFPDDLSQPMFRGGNLHVELAERSVGTAYGGLGANMTNFAPMRFEVVPSSHSVGC